MNIVLHVISDFANYAKGEIIRDLEAIEAALASNPHHVVPVAAPESATKSTTPSTESGE